MKKKHFHIIGPVIGLLLFAVALSVIHHSLAKYHYRDILFQLSQIPAEKLILAMWLTALSYLVMTGYDALALRFLEHPLSYGKIALASFIGYSFSHNVGFSFLSGAPARFRVYSSWGLSAMDIAKVVAFCGLTFWLGFFSLGGFIFLVDPPKIPDSFFLPASIFRPLGIFLLIMVASYLVWSAVKKKPLKFRGMVWEHPPFSFFLSQMLLSSVDWAVAASVIYVLLPVSVGVSYFAFLGIFLVAQISGLISQVPGGLGVFETVILLFLSPSIPATSILGVLVAYRGIYYLLPLFLATILLGIHEIIVLVGKSRNQTGNFTDPGNHG